jgi:pimeloyl-ACP methyl ester carboxylesterase
VTPPRSSGTLAGLDHFRAGSGPPLLLLHGLGSTWRVYWRQLPRLAAERDVLAVDLPGFGESAPLPGTEASVYALTDAVEAALDEAGWERPVVVGNSMGGWISCELARRGRAAGVLAISPAGMQTEKEGRYSAMTMRMGHMQGRMLRPLVPAILSNPVGRTMSMYPYFGRAWAVDAEDAISTFRYGAKAPAFEAAVEWLFSHRPQGLEEIRCPVRILWGTRDALLPPRQGPRWERAIPGAELRPLRGLGHTPFYDDPGMMTRAILDAPGSDS